MSDLEWERGPNFSKAEASGCTFAVRKHDGQWSVDVDRPNGGFGLPVNSREDGEKLCEDAFGKPGGGGQ